MPRNFEGEFFMASGYTKEITTDIIKGTLGYGNLGTIGPESDREAGQADDLGRPEYSAPPREESHCMDDRLEVYGIQLAGNRAITETAATYMDPAADKVPLSQALAEKVRELVSQGFMPNFHEGCAALLVLANRQALRYMADPTNRPLVIGLTDTRLRLVGIDTLAPNDYENALDTAADSLAIEELWDATPEQLMAIAKENGAGIDPIEGDHAAVGARWDMSEDTFNNTAFRRDHSTDKGDDMGALSVTLGAYKAQLEKSGVMGQRLAEEMLRATLYQVAVLKVAQKENAPDVIVGAPS